MIIDRRTAIRNGLNVFYIKPCKYGHTDGRFVSNNKCVKCFETNRQYSIDIKKEKITDVKNTRKKFREIKLPHVRKVRSDLSILVSRIKSNASMLTVSCVGYSASSLKSHLESLFIDGMSWHNIGEWEIDHIIPIYKYTLSNIDYSPDGFSVLVNKLTNLQPLWKEDNRKKSCKF